MKLLMVSGNYERCNDCFLKYILLESTIKKCFLFFLNYFDISTSKWYKNIYKINLK